MLVDFHLCRIGRPSCWLPAATLNLFPICYCCDGCDSGMRSNSAAAPRPRFTIQNCSHKNNIALTVASFVLAAARPGSDRKLSLTSVECQTVRHSADIVQPSHISEYHDQQRFKTINVYHRTYNISLSYCPAQMMTKYRNQPTKLRDFSKFSFKILNLLVR